MEASSMKFTRGTRKRNEKGRRSWSQREEDVLIAGLKEIVANRWKSENGFKIGYLQSLEQYMQKKFPGTDIKAIPHINSKIHVWKKNYSSLLSMLSRSGIGWNDTSKMIEANDEAWEAYVKVDSNARLMRYKSWPFYHDWYEIFGKDRATGVQAEDFVEVVNQVLNGCDEKDADLYENFDKMFEGFDCGDSETISVCQAGSSASGKKQSGKKRKSMDTNDPIYDLLGTFCQNTDARLGEIAKRIGYDYDISNARKKVFSVVGNIVRLTLHEKLLVSKLLVKDNEDLELFFSLPDDAKGEFAKMKLAGSL